VAEHLLVYVADPMCSWCYGFGKTLGALIEDPRDATVVNDKETGTRTKDVTITGKDGETRTADTVTQRTDTGYTRDTTYTDKNGNTATPNPATSPTRYVRSRRNNGMQQNTAATTGKIANSLIAPAKPNSADVFSPRESTSGRRMNA